MPYTWLLDPKSVVNWAPTKPYNSSKISIERNSNLLIEMSQEADYILGPWQKALDLAQERLDNPDVSDQDKYYALRCLIFTYIIYGHAGKYTEIQITKMLSELNPKLEQPSLVHYWYFNVFRGQKTDEALDFWKKFTISFKNYPQGHASYIAALINSGHLSEADSLIRKIPAEHRDIIEIKLAEALYKIRTSKYGEAYNILKKVELEPKSLSCAKQHALYKCELCIKDKNYDGCLVECAYLLKLAYCDKQLIYISFKYAQEAFEMKGKNTLSYLTACQMLKIKENDSYAKEAIRNLVEKIKAQLH
ncbi:hypothetical protein KIH39_00235 [Telmatocola sphagniphila]|uniref:Uncharacterized protein n=1 Tax=Telmatocola sphagniphila TaxID=1123043 RepID=A0A8E6B5M2_9BACT|nr:hypothetical protein [Telmatocola sphagniphila]QVL32383.1 hypothetical protein KIH39_00235 [Telmatocola sphagniphila]